VIQPDDAYDTPDFLARLRGGDEAAYRRLVRRYHASLIGIAQAVIGSRAQAEEVVQDSWIAVYRNIGRFEGRSSLAGWLFTIVRNRARTRIVSENRTVGLEGLSSGGPSVGPENFRADGHWTELPALWDELDPERQVGGRQLWEIVHEVIQLLPDAQKAAIVMRDIEGQSGEDVCALLGVSAENQRVLLHRARGKVRAAIDAAMAQGQPRGANVVIRAAKAARDGMARLGLALARWARRVQPPRKFCAAAL
jgi:RNA polymerase sigma-70 factor, ECF subfamily